MKIWALRLPAIIARERALAQAEAQQAQKKKEEEEAKQKRKEEEEIKIMRQGTISSRFLELGVDYHTDLYRCRLNIVKYSES